MTFCFVLLIEKTNFVAEVLLRLARMPQTMYVGRSGDLRTINYWVSTD